MDFSIVLSLSALAVATASLWYIRHLVRESAAIAKEASGYADRAEAAADRAAKARDLSMTYVVNNHAMSPAEAAAAVQREARRGSLRGGFGR
ncbi:hypothetical protein [Nocardia sp. CY41]|uniref:hypothetical protein n=1 Tax=Nocardia sp. CY41 TaxID=2608686 RepID=UPI001358010B|nr:hypothetical protein [Nocardia sp. CY41]